LLNNNIKINNLQLPSHPAIIILLNHTYITKEAETMTKNEKSIILSAYKDIYYTHNIVKIDKSDSLREFKFLLNSLNLKKESYQVENEIIAETNNLKITVIEMYKMIFETFAKYNTYINYNLEEINIYYEELQWEFTEEENKCHKARVKYIEES